MPDECKVLGRNPGVIKSIIDAGWAPLDSDNAQGGIGMPKPSLHRIAIIDRYRGPMRIRSQCGCLIVLVTIWQHFHDKVCHTARAGFAAPLSPNAIRGGN